MAASGNFIGSVQGNAGSYFTFMVSWQRNSCDTANNTSNITISLSISSTNFNTYNRDRYPSVSLSVNGAIKTPTIDYIDLRGDIVECIFATWTGDVTHNDDGTLNCPINASFTHYGSSNLTGGSATGYAELDTIPRASSITSASDVTLGKACNVKWTPMATSFWYKLKFSMGDWECTTDAINPNKTTEHTYTGYTIPLDAANQLPNATTGSMTVTLYTYSDGEAITQIGDSDSKAFSVVVPNDINTSPTVTMTLSPVSSLIDAFNGLYIQGKTKVKARLSATGKYGATIKSYSMKVEGNSYDSEDDYTSGYLSQYGNITVTGYATDSRGFTSSKEIEIPVIAYSKPKILAASGESNVIAARCDANGNLIDSGTYLKIKAKRSYSKVESGGEQNNFCQIRYKLEGDSSWVTILAAASLDSDEIVTEPLLDGNLLATNSYLVQVQAIDDIGDHAETTISVPTDKVYMHRTKNAMGLGKYAEGENLLDVGWDAHFHGEVRIGETGMTLKEYILAVISEGG